MSKDSSAFSPRPTVPRLAPIEKKDATPEQLAMLASRPDYNIYKTLAHDPELYARWSPLGQILLNGSSIPAHDREIVMLRMGWLCQAQYEWAQHARIARSQAGLTSADLHRIAAGPTAQGWSDFDRVLLTMVDEIRYEAFISDATWSALHARYSDQQVMEALFTASQYQLVSMALNSLGVQLDPGLEDRLPTDVPLPKPASQPRSPRLKTPRIAPIPASDWSDEQRALVGAQLRDGKLPNLYGTMLHFPTLYGPRVKFGSYLQRDSHLPPRTRELVILRTATLIGAEYEWAHHAGSAKAAGLTDAEISRIRTRDLQGWDETDKATLEAVDALRREAFIGDTTYVTLAKHFDTRQLIEIIYTSGGYTMTGVALNSLGVQMES